MTSFLEHVSFEEHIEDELDSKCVCNGFLQRMEMDEEGSFLRFPEGHSLCPQVRSTCVQLMRRLSIKHGWPQAHWFDSVVLFDAFCAHFHGGPSKKKLPALCAAVLRLRARKASANTADFDASTVGSSKIDSEKMEKAVLQALDWHVDPPGLRTWLDTYIQ